MTNKVLPLKRLLARKDCFRAELFLDAEEFIVFCDTVSSAE
jgi:hypothetical protein